MAKRSKVVANERRKRTVERLAKRRSELRHASRDLNLTLEERMAASRALSRLLPDRCRERFGDDAIGVLGA